MHKPPTQGSDGPAVILNVDKLNELRRALAIKSEADLARLIGVDTATLFRVTSGRTAPSNAFIARMKVAFPSVALDDLFIVRTEVERVAS